MAAKWHLKSTGAPDIFYIISNVYLEKVAGGRWQVAGGRWQVAGGTYFLLMRKKKNNKKYYVVYMFFISATLRTVPPIKREHRIA
ncbi:hypothetical protein [Candidatus Williamhamiltonella defendens]|uniref:hypothetical protein n=1 Tax=Candidatus Williamhamiltonella defendens TaxID=138072 RepID=UPI0011D07E6D|nr:hypothetical protein [Candidatus Hamiltonella defensa]